MEERLMVFVDGSNLLRATGTKIGAKIRSDKPSKEAIGKGVCHAYTHWITYDGFLEESAKLYANGRDLKDPFISPVYGDLSGFPPTFLGVYSRRW